LWRQKLLKRMAYNLPMPNPILSRSWMLTTLLFALMPTGEGQTTSDFVGQWVMKLGPRVFFVLTVTPQKGAKSSVAGFIARPQRSTTSDGRSFFGITNTILQEPITHSEVKDGWVILTVQNPKKPSDEDKYQIALADSTHLKLKEVDFPFEPNILVKTQTPSTPATDWDVAKTYSDEDSVASNSEMQRLFEEDQRVRQPGLKIDWTVVSKSDAERREATQSLLREDKLHTGEDFERAAFIFQHGTTSNDYLLAHTLGMVAVKKGRASAVWIATATLDRYLNSIHQPQIFGTQYFTKPNEPTMQEPYDRTLISDALRRQLSVPPQSAQDEQRKQFDVERNIQK
jgi:hypothetical protein